MIDITGQKFGRWTAVEFSHKDKWRKPYWRCVCECGKIGVKIGGDLRRGASRSCGCLRVEQLIARVTTHGHASAGNHSPEYQTYNGMLSRCLNPKNKFYSKYGGRGIAICEEWRGSFQTFLNHMGRKPSPDHSIERRDNNLGYYPSNCYWGTKTEQANNRSNCKHITFEGKTMTHAQWERHLGWRRGTIGDRIRILGWPPLEAVCTKPGEKRKLQ